MSAAAQSGRDILARIRPTLAEESTEICLRPDLIEAYNDATEELANVRASSSNTDRRLGSTHTAAEREAAQRVQELEEEIAAHAVVFRFRALPKDQARAIKDNHPPRKGNDLDLYAGYDRDAVGDEMVRRSLVDPEFDDESWTELVAVVNDGEWAEMRRTAESVNGGAWRAPKSELASRILSSPDGDSKPPEAGGPAPVSSTVGRRKRSTSTSTSKAT